MFKVVPIAYYFNVWEDLGGGVTCKSEIYFTKRKQVPHGNKEKKNNDLKWMLLCETRNKNEFEEEF